VAAVGLPSGLLAGLGLRLRLAVLICSGSINGEDRFGDLRGGATKGIEGECTTGDDEVTLEAASKRRPRGAHPALCNSGLVVSFGL